MIEYISALSKKSLSFDGRLNKFDANIMQMK